MSNFARMIRCYAEGRPGQWEAFCLDFDLAVQGKSFAEVFEGMNLAVDEYRAHVRTLPEVDQDRLLARRAPLSLRLTFLWKALLFTVLGGRGGSSENQRAEFMLPAAA
ncbi:MAG: hypothetical protein ACREER_02400 [Alphaproteobacteria bacterium]